MPQVWVVYVLIALCAAISLYAFYVDEKLIDRLSLHVDRVLRAREHYRIFTSGFVHVSIGHLVVNMLTLYFFGRSLEAGLGPMAFFAIYLGAEVTANTFSLYAKRRELTYASIGASGAVSGVVFSFCLFQPMSPIYIFFAPLGVPAILYAIAYVLYSAYAINDRTGGGVAHEAHLGGAAGGVIVTALLYPKVIFGFLFGQ